MGGSNKPLTSIGNDSRQIQRSFSTIQRKTGYQGKLIVCLDRIELLI